LIVLDGKSGLTAERCDDMRVACFEIVVRNAEDPVKLSVYDDREEIEDIPASCGRRIGSTVASADRMNVCGVSTPVSHDHGG
jgi:hypothetical protein